MNLLFVSTFLVVKQQKNIHGISTFTQLVILVCVPVSLVFVAVCTEVTSIPYTIMLTDVSVQVSQVFKHTTTVFAHTR